MAKNPKSDDQAKTDGPISPPVAADAVNQDATVLRADAGHLDGPARPNFLNAKQPKTAAVQQGSSQVLSEVSTNGSGSEPSDSYSEDYNFLPPKLRQRMQALMAELSLEEEPVETFSNALPEDSSETEQEIEAATEIELQRLEQQLAEEQQPAEAATPEVTTSAPDVPEVIVPEPGDLVELVEVDHEVDTVTSLFDDIDEEELARLGIQTHPIGSVSETNASESAGQQGKVESAEAADTIPFVEIPADECSMTTADTEVALETVKYMDPSTLQQLQDEDAAAVTRDTDSLEEAAVAQQQDLERQQELTDTTETFSQQASEIVEILKLKQIELARYREQLAIGKARTENELRQQRLELVEKKREFLEEVSQFRKSLKKQQSQNSRPAVQSAHASDRRQEVAAPPVAADTGSQGRRITLESIAMPGSHLRKEVEVVANVRQARSVNIDDLDANNLDPEFLSAIEQHISETRSPAKSQPQPSAVTEESIHEPQALHSLSQARLQQQAESLKKQHSAAVGSLRKTRRQLELLRNVVVQQQQQTAERASDLDLEHEQWTSTRSIQMQELEVDRRELDRLTAVRENELSKRETAALQRENAVRQLEAKLQQAQVEILRDRVILRQLERTARQTLSNTQWNDRLAIITEETEGYLRQMQAQAEQMKAEAGKQIKRLDSRQSELLLYRESLRNWVQRQMKLISRRSAHLEEREENVQQRWQAISEARTELQNHQHALNEIIRGGLNQIDDQLDEPNEQRLNDAA